MCPRRKSLCIIWKSESQRRRPSDRGHGSVIGLRFVHAASRRTTSTAPRL
jgi:hypothetical protein